VLYVTAEILRQVGILAQPFVPTSAAKLLDLLAVPAADREFSALTAEQRVKAGAMLPPPAPVFPRYVEAEEKA
jgi:methionyl-tRNA synthetase